MITSLDDGKGPQRGFCGAMARGWTVLAKGLSVRLRDLLGSFVAICRSRAISFRFSAGVILAHLSLAITAAAAFFFAGGFGAPSALEEPPAPIFRIGVSRNE